MITLEATNTRTHVTFTAKFHTEEQAIEFMDRKASTLAFTLDEAINYVDTPKIIAHLFPSCEHGLSLSLCEGPNHYPAHM